MGEVIFLRVHRLLVWPFVVLVDFVLIVGLFSMQSAVYSLLAVLLTENYYFKRSTQHLMIQGGEVSLSKKAPSILDDDSHDLHMTRVLHPWLK